MCLSATVASMLTRPGNRGGGSQRESGCVPVLLVCSSVDPFGEQGGNERERMCISLSLSLSLIVCINVDSFFFGI